MVLTFDDFQKQPLLPTTPAIGHIGVGATIELYTLAFPVTVKRHTPNGALCYYITPAGDHQEVNVGPKEVRRILGGSEAKHYESGKHRDNDGQDDSGKGFPGVDVLHSMS